MVDFVGRTELFDEDWAEMMGHLHSRGIDVDYVQPQVANAGKTNSIGRACPTALQHVLFNATTLENIARHYARDLHLLWGDDVWQ